MTDTLSPNTGYVAAAYLEAATDQHHTEHRILTSQAVLHQPGVARFENPRRQCLARQQRGLQRKHG